MKAFGQKGTKSFKELRQVQCDLGRGGACEALDQAEELLQPSQQKSLTGHLRSTSEA